MKRNDVVDVEIGPMHLEIHRLLANEAVAVLRLVQDARQGLALFGRQLR
jgi:hypothetical protein